MACVVSANVRYHIQDYNAAMVQNGRLKSVWERNNPCFNALKGGVVEENSGMVRAMPILSPAELLSSLSRDQRLLGLDLGSKTIGLALSDVSRTIATPYDTIRRTKFTKDAEELLAVVDKQGVGGLVLGLPVEMDGFEGPRCQSVRSFAANLARLRDMPIAYWDERLSTSAVTRTLLEADSSRKRRAEVVDKMAAAYILQGLLDNRTGFA
jgi:putative Holliday junction resolvase